MAIGKICWYSADTSGKGFLEDQTTGKPYEFHAKLPLKRNDEVIYEVSPQTGEIMIVEKTKKNQYTKKLY